MSAFHIGIIEGVMPAVKMITIPTWGVVADLLRNKKLVQLICVIFSTAILMLLAFDNIASSFQRILLISIGVSLFSSGNLLDAYTFDVLGKRYQRRYGTIRLWAAVAWGLGCALMGWLNDFFGGFRVNFILYASLATISVVIFMSCIPNQTSVEAETQHVEWIWLWNSLTTGEMLFFLFEITVMV